MDIINFDALKAQGKVLPADDVDLTEDYFIIGKRNVHYNTNSFKATEYPIYAIKAGDVIGANTKYKVYTALLSQSGTRAPSALVFENTIGDITLTYQAPGEYYITSNSLFTNGKVYAVISNNRDWYDTGSIMTMTVAIQSASSIYIRTGNVDSHYDDILIDVPIEIRVYN